MREPSVASLRSTLPTCAGSIGIGYSWPVCITKRCHLASRGSTPLLNFTVNCTVVGLYFASAHVGQNDTIRTEFFRQALPAEYRDNFTFADIGNYTLSEEAERLAKEVCRPQICD